MINKKSFLLLFLFLLFPTLVFSYHVLSTGSQGNIFIVWNTTPVNFRVDGGTLGGENGIPLIQDACDEWNDIEEVVDICGNLTSFGEDITLDNFSDVIRIDGSIISLPPNDGVNDIVFDETGEILSALGFGSTTLGVGITVSSSGSIIDSVLIINGSVPSTPAADLLSTVVHEFGHIWGLAHTPVGGINSSFSSPNGLDPMSASSIPTMFFSSNPENDQFGRDLEFDDIAVMKIRYPEN